MDFKIFGQVRLCRSGEWREDWQAAKIRGLLGVLLTKSGKTLLVNEAIEWLWGRDADPVRHVKTLQTYVYRLRTALSEAGVQAPVKLVNSGYRMDIDRDRVDYYRVQELLVDGQRAARSGDHEATCEVLPEALELAAEPLLIDLETELARSLRRQVLTNLVMPIHYTLMDSQLALGHPERVLRTLSDLQPEHELNVTLAKKRIQALRAADSDHEATEYFLSTRRLLVANDLLEEAGELLGFFNQVRSQVRAGPQPEAGSPQPGRRKRWRLPRDLRDFSGRADLLAELDEFTDRGAVPGVLLLMGTAGVGKTALLAHWANGVRDRFPDGGYYLDMRGFSRRQKLDGDDLVRRLLRFLGESPDLLSDPTGQWERLSELLDDRRMLLLLDNVADVAQVEKLLDVARESTIIVASRHHLNCLPLNYGAQQLHVPVLKPDVARHWLRDSVGSRAGSDPDAVRELADLCSGIPLALRIVGQYAHERAEVPLAEIVRFLRAEHSLLCLGDDGSGEVSVRASFGLSYRTLREPVRRMFRLLGLHPVSRFALGPAAALVGTTEQQAREVLDVLVNSHLVEQKAERYELHDLLHDFAVEQSEVDQGEVERDEAMTRLLDWYSHTAGNAERKIFPYRPGVPLLPIDEAVTAQEFDDDQDALTWYWQERDALLAAVRAAHRRGFHGHVWRLANAINEPLKRYSCYQEALEALELGLGSAREEGDDFGETLSLNTVGYVHLHAGEPNAAYDHFVACHRIARSMSEVNGVAASLHNMACQRLRINDLDSAERLFTEALEIQLLHGLDHIRAVTLRRLGELRHRQSDFTEAGVLYHEALALHRSVGNAHGAGEVLGELSQLHLDRGDVQTAIDFGKQALVSHERSRDLVSVASAHCILAKANHRRNRIPAAVEHARTCVRICWRTKDVETEAKALELLGEALYAQGHVDAAVDGWKQARDLYRSRGDDRWVAVAERLKQI